MQALASNDNDFAALFDAMQETLETYIKTSGAASAVLALASALDMQGHQYMAEQLGEIVGA